MRGAHEPQAQGLGLHDPSQPHTPLQSQPQPQPRARPQSQTTPTQTPRASQRLSQLPFPLPTFVTTSPASPAPDTGTGAHGLGLSPVRAPRGHDNSRVLDRISALLHKDEPAEASNSLQVPGAGTPTSEPSAHSFEIEFHDRPAIKVLVVTWNMGDALVSLSNA